MVRTSNVRRIIERTNANNCSNYTAAQGQGGLNNGFNVNYLELLCPQIEIPTSQTAGNDPNQTTIQRISQQLQHPLGGTTVFGINGNPIPVNYLGRREGQSGGSGAPIRNTF
jgi:hypothetical protein